MVTYCSRNQQQLLTAAIAYIFANCQDCRILCAIASTCCHKSAKNAHKQLSYRGVQKGSTTVSALAQICDPDNCTQ